MKTEPRSDKLLTSEMLTIQANRDLRIKKNIKFISVPIFVPMKTYATEGLAI